MTSFVPLNIIPDSDSEGEVDNTQEIQIEEALKLYQRALRLHTDGEWEEAHKAYEDLFRSEIFEVDVEEEVHGPNTSVTSSLPLVHYLSFKNHGAFKLGQLKASIPSLSQPQIDDAVGQALEWFATALGCDAGDSSLWRESAQLALVLSSARLARFALESVLDHETVGADAAKDALSLVSGANPNPEDYLALIQLRKILERMDDTVSLLDKRFQKLTGRKLNKKFIQFQDPLPWLPVPAPESLKPLSSLLDQFSETREIVDVNSKTWSAVGSALLSLISTDDGIDDIVTPSRSSTLQIILPTTDEADEDSRDSTPEETSPPESASKSENVVTDNEDVSMADPCSNLAPALDDRQRSVSSNRKRKSTSMGVDGADSGRSRLSKRQRDKKAADAAAAEAAAATPESKAKVRQDTQDEKLFNTADECFSPFGLSLGNASILKIKTSDVTDNSSTEESLDPCDLYLDDFKTILQTWDDDKGNVILYGDGIQSPAEAAQGMSFMDLEANLPAQPLLVGDEGLRRWTKSVNTKGLCPNEVAFEWIKALCKKDVDPRSRKPKSFTVSHTHSSWVKHHWSEFLKTTVLRMANICEDICVRHFKTIEDDLTFRLVAHNPQRFTTEDYANVEFAETMLEVYIDDLCSAEREKESADVSTVADVDLIVKKQRVQRWMNIVRDLMSYRPRDPDGQLEEDQLTLRHLWATTVNIGLTDDCPRELQLACFEDLKVLLAEKPSVYLPNSAVMPEISAIRADREISKLKTVDFFSTIFAATSETTEKDPEEVIELLEAVLEPGRVLPYDEEEERILHEIGQYLNGSSAMFKLNLWEKLKAAYEKINYRPKVLACTLRCMQVVTCELKSKSYLESSQDHRQFVLLRSLRLFKGRMSNLLDLIGKNETYIDELTEQELTDALGSTLLILRLLHCYAFWESAVMKSEVKSSDLHSYRLVVMKLKELLVEAWVVAYIIYADMLKRGLGCDRPDGWLEGEREERIAGLLRDLHEEFGARHYCRLADNLFLKLMFDELLKIDNRDYDGDLLQVLHCRFHLTLCADQWYFFDHKTTAEVLNKQTAWRLVDFILHQSSKKKILQLTKSDLKAGLDKLVDVFGIPRPDDTRVKHNLAIIDSYLKSTINPLNLFGCLRGNHTISTVRVYGEWKNIASKGLYFLQGKMALYPSRYNKRVGPLKTDEMEPAMQYFRHDISCNPESWETWYRMGQTFELQVEDMQTWNAEYINSRRQDVVNLERKTILCYMMAVSLAVRYAKDDPSERTTLSSLYTEFGYRIYSAAKPPMGLESFWTDGFERHFSGRNGQGMYTQRPHAELNLAMALKYALFLFQNALVDGNDVWRNHYMIGKCTAKLQKVTDSVEYTPETALQHYLHAIKLCPEKGSEYIYEPHHKLISTACKFVLDEKLDPHKACEILQGSRFSKQIPFANDRASFVQYSIEFLKKMKTADKSKWHHRMTYRMTLLRYHELADAEGARVDLMLLFTKQSGQLSIWKPEFERAGRHFVFASRYTVLYAEILEKLGDRATLEVLSKRVRRAPQALFRHTETWSIVFDRYINVLRQNGGVSKDLEDEVFKSLSFDEFTTYSQRLDNLCNNKEIQSPTLDLLREVFELRKLNAGLAKNPWIDELLADTYAKLWQELVPGIIIQLKQENEKQQNPMSLKNMMFDAPSVNEAASGTSTATSGKMDVDLPLRGKMTRVTRRELISKATSLCKEMGLVIPTSKAAPGSATGGGSPTAPSSPKAKVTRPSSPSGSTNTASATGDLVKDEMSEDGAVSLRPVITIIASEG